MTPYCTLSPILRIVVVVLLFSSETEQEESKCSTVLSTSQCRYNTQKQSCPTTFIHHHNKEGRKREMKSHSLNSLPCSLSLYFSCVAIRIVRTVLPD